MNKKLIGGQKPFRILVSNLKGSSDPSRGAAFNPQPKRSQFEMQFFPEIGGRGQLTTPRSSRSKGTSTRVGLVEYTVPPIPVRATGTISVVNNTFLGPTTVVVGKYEFLSGFDFSVTGAAVSATASAEVLVTPSTATITINGVALTPAGGARTPGANNYNNTLGTVNAIMLDVVAAINDPANGFAAIASASAGAGGVLNLQAVVAGYAGNGITLSSSNATVGVSGATFTGGLDTTGVTAISLAAAIDATLEFSAVALNDDVTVTGLSGPLGNEVAFYATGGSPNNFSFSPTDLSMSGAEPRIGPPAIT